MMILALEFSSPQRSVAVLAANRPAGPGAAHSSPARAKSRMSADHPLDGVICEAIETGGPGTQAFSLIEKVLAEAGIEREQIDVIGVGLGPGSYTGVRVALALAQGWQLARGVRLLGIGSAECVAAQAQAEQILGRVSVVMDAQRNEFYLASYEISMKGWKEIEPLRIGTRAEVEARAGAGEVLVGPEVTRWFPGGRTIFPRAARLGQLARNRNDFVPGDQLEPVYLRETNYVKAPPPRTVGL